MTTRYEQLGILRRKFEQEKREYIHRCGEFAAALIQGFAAYLGAPTGRVRQVAPDPRGERVVAASSGFLEIDDDGWWLVRVEVDLVASRTRGQFLFQFRADKSRYQVKIGDDPRVLEVRAQENPALDLVFDEAYGIAKQVLTFDATRGYREERQPRRIGFITEPEIRDEGPFEPQS